MKFSVIVLALFVSCTSCAVTMRLLPVRLQAERAVEVGVLCEGKPRTMQIGSGVLVDSRHVLTAYHVVSCRVVAAVAILAGGQQVALSVERAAVSADVAWLVLAGQVPVPRVEIADAPSPGARVCMESAQPARHRVCGLSMMRIHAEGQEIKFSFQPIPGNSGSGLYDSRGRLIGIVTHRGQAFGLATSLSPRRWLFASGE